MGHFFQGSVSRSEVIYFEIALDILTETSDIPLLVSSRDKDLLLERGLNYF